MAEATNKVAGAKITAGIVYKNSFVSFGFNQLKSHPFQLKYSRNSESIFLHAETSAICNGLKIISADDFRKSTLYICRVKNKGDHSCWGLSKPCEGCMRAIVTFGMKKVVYSDEGEYFENHQTFYCD
jgi:deoxycytidylate deaminase